MQAGEAQVEAAQGVRAQEARAGVVGVGRTQ